MVGADQVISTGGGVGVGLGSTLIVRQQLDADNETTVFRPSVLWGVGTGVASLGVPMLMDGRQRGLLWDFLEDYGETALAAGVFSAFAPKGGGVRFPTL